MIYAGCAVGSTCGDDSSLLPTVLIVIGCVVILAFATYMIIRAVKKKKK